MTIVIDTYDECVRVLDAILSSITTFIERHTPELEPYIAEAILYARSQVLSDICLRIQRGELPRVTERRIEKRTYLKFIEEFIPIILNEDVRRTFNINPIIDEFIDEIIALNYDLLIIKHYTPYRTDVIEQLIISRAKVEGLEIGEVEYVINAVKSLTTDRLSYFAYLLTMYYHLLQYHYIPDDIYWNIGFYVQELETLYQLQILEVAPIHLLLEITNQMAIRAIIFTVAFALESNNIELLNKIADISYIDKYHLMALNILLDEKLINEEQYVDNITYIIYISEIAKSYRHYRVAVEFAKLYAYDFITNMPKRFKEQIDKIIGTKLGDLIGLYDKAFTTISSTINAIDMVYIKIYKHIKTKEYILKVYEETLTLIEEVEEKLEQMMKEYYGKSIKHTKKPTGVKLKEKYKELRKLKAMNYLYLILYHTLRQIRSMLIEINQKLQISY